ncbi:MAG: hydroxymethylglutaryl-CoA lyase [Trueperaceae bacterium]|nr:hydroxymethylglutaryl-CoA lyase [Trueperaceae bacterium]
MLRYVECPRDSWQGLSRFIPTETKIAYLQALLDAGFKYLDMGSFVSPRAVPQLADTEEVLAGLGVPKDAHLLCIIANERGLERALGAQNLQAVGYPLSVNDTFQRRNTNRSLDESWDLLKEMYEATKPKLELVIYLSMGFGNPYGERWFPEDTARAVEKLREMGVQDIALADTVGTASPELIQKVLSQIEKPETLGLHLHARPYDWQEKLERALELGISWFEGALAGIGGCPFAKDDLTGNLPTEQVLPFLCQKLDESLRIRLPPLTEQASQLATTYQ